MKDRLSTRGSDVRQLASFGVIGVFSTLAYVLLYSWLRLAVDAQAANLIALLVTAVANTAANRRLTFQVSGREGMARDQAAGLLALIVALAITSGSLAMLAHFAPRHARWIEIAVLVAANAAATLVRFLLLRLLISRPRQAQAPAPIVTATLTPIRRTRG